ncbi:S-adenosylmethionine--2-demethylmenaquinone methyltransferase [Malaciobacter molluscorum]|uniref:ribonuclease E activity regulator RraA n=1 Tax=Malaciobacter molluscorum TaxID=1032072 RepID=UPI00100B9571|nr:ribonuclease E activity regulator RraA [Malaciobacter molluscorum]RXJ96350.1 S-adenosylmethionine--2-demethylmenaquinone methyltransferase [Malaciobacter molluscorum]
MYYKTADLCDMNQDKKIQLLSKDFKSYGGKKGFFGQIKTLKLNKSNWALIDMLKNTSGNNKIIVVDVEEAYFGIVGDILSSYAEKNNYQALIINGYVRDSIEIKKSNIGLYAIGTCPLRCFEKTDYKTEIELNFGNVCFNEGDYIYADEDGVIISSEKLNTTNVQKRH